MAERDICTDICVYLINSLVNEIHALISVCVSR